MSNKEIIRRIEEMLQNGTSLPVIFKALGGTDDMARLIVSVPSFQDRERYSRANTVLFLAFMYVAILKTVFPVIGFIRDDIPLVVLPFALLWSLAAGFFAIQIRAFRGTAYIPGGLVCVAILLSSVQAHLETEVSIASFVPWVVANVPVLVGAYLCFYLKTKLCPFLGYSGARTDSEGKYSFENVG